MLLSDEDFVKSVWEKYNDYISFDNNDNFFITKKYKKNRKALSLVAGFVIAMIATVSVAYTGVVVYNNYIQKNTNTNFVENSGYSYLDDMILVDKDIDLYYKKVTDYDEYLQDCNKWNNLVEMSEEDFKSSFLIVIAGGNYDTISLSVTEIYVQDETLYINLKQTENINLENTVLSLKLDNNYNKDEIIINIENIEVSLGNEFVELEKLPEDYTVEQALNDGCFVIENNIMLNYENMLDEFINDTYAGKESSIRVADFADNSTIINDIVYKDGFYYIKKYILKGGNKEQYYKKSEKIVKLETAYETTYYLEDILGNQVSIGTIR